MVFSTAQLSRFASEFPSPASLPLPYPTFKLVGVPRYNPVRVLPEDLHLALVRFAHAVAFESVFISALLSAHLAVPSQLLETFGFDSIRDYFGG
ncbi:hypothetical protein V6N13_121917 [Hibiscus sabdariffa]|uniref:Uncharacterized protein n=2 Tax=Hibiscus sabdariffa TaxID=183260 RepID=A0ABR2NE58_9ROSI